mgnify:CR=1 FL=1
MAKADQRVAPLDFNDDETNGQEQTVSYDIYGVPAVFLLKTKIPDSLTQTLNEHLDCLLKSDSKQSHAGRLAGRIKRGQQLTLDPECSEMRRFSELMTGLGADYYNHFQSAMSCQLPRKKILVDELWSVHSFAGDYNPIHDHSNLNTGSLSFAGWTQTPASWEDGSGTSEQRGELGGSIAFLWGPTSSVGLHNLRPPAGLSIKPEPGVFYLFPSWLEHCVYPFDGAGERRTIAGNLAAIDLEDGP